MGREELSGKMKLAEHTEQYNVMVDLAKQLIQEFGEDITNEERTLFSIAYKQAVSERRNSFRVLSQYLEKEKQRNPQNVTLVEQYKNRVYNETVALCNEVIQLIDTKLFKEDSTAEGLDTRVFFLKMKGDYYRYAAEVGDTSAIENGRAAYSAAQQAAEPLPPSNPNKLGLALNYSVFYYEVLKDQDSACQLAQSTFDAALPTLDDLEEQSYKEATNILGLMRDNLTIWSDEGNNRDD